MIENPAKTKKKKYKIKELKCAICGNIFFSDAPRSPLYCSSKCKDMGRTMVNHRWRENNKQHIREYMKEYRQKNDINKTPI